MYRPDKTGTHRVVYESNKRRILKTERICGICGKEVNKNLKYPDPLSPTIDHIIPISKGGHPSDINNLQLTHFTCNRAKSDKLFKNVVTEAEGKEKVILSNRHLPQTIDWMNYKSQ